MRALKIGGPVECADLNNADLYRGVRECGTSELNRCTCGLRRVVGSRDPRELAAMGRRGEHESSPANEVPCR